MHTHRTRQNSLRSLTHNKKFDTFCGPSKLLPELSEVREKDNRGNRNKDLTQTILKFRHNNQQEILKYSDELLRSVISVIKSFSQTNNNFQDLFEEIYVVLKRFTFILDDVEVEKILSDRNIRKGYSFRRSFIQFEAEFENMTKEKTERVKTANYELEKIQEEWRLAEIKFNDQLAFMESEVIRYKQLANIEYTKSLEEQVKELNNEVKELNDQCKSLIFEKKRLDRELEEINNKLDDQTIQMENTRDSHNLIERKLKKNEGYFESLRNRFDELLIKLMGMNEVIAKVEEENNILTSERMKLVSRAAVSFDEFTPRPKYREILGINEKVNVCSTKEIFGLLLENKSITMNDLLSKITIKEKSDKLKKVNKKRIQIVEDVINAKEELSKLQSIESMFSNF